MTPFDHVLGLTLALFVPIYAQWSSRQMKRAILSGEPHARISSYASAISSEWVLATIVLVWWITAGRSSEMLGLGFSLETPMIVTSVLVVIVSLLFLSQLRSLGSLDDVSRDKIRQRIGGADLVMPRDEGERSVFMSLSIAAGFCEELLFRGFLITWMAGFVGAVPALLLSSAAFGISHGYQGATGILKTGLAGAILGGLFLVTGSIWPGVILHIVLDIQGGLTGYAVFRESRKGPDPHGVQLPEPEHA